MCPDDSNGDYDQKIGSIEKVCVPESELGFERHAVAEEGDVPFSGVAA